jgi:hypothetical protein
LCRVKEILVPFNLADFRNTFFNGGARPSQFEMQVVWPAAVRGVAGVPSAEHDFRFLCQISEIPSETVSVINVPYFGRILKYAGERKWENLTVRVINDENFEVRRAIEAWMSAIADHSTTVSQFDGSITSTGYVTDGVVTQMSRNQGGAAIQAYQFVGMWPTELGKIDLSWAAADEIETFPITFAYQYWQTVDPTTGASLTT